MRRLSLLFSAFVLGSSLPLFAQAATARAPEPSLRRWFELQTVTLGARYRLIQSSAKRITSNDLQYREIVRGRFNVDSKRRFTLNAGTGSGSSFISGWDNTGAGISDADYHNHYLKLLYAAAVPVPGLEIQFGGIPTARGEHTEISTYDDDGFAMGTRATLRRPADLYLDELTVTRGTIGPYNSPSVFARFRELDDPNYTQLLIAKRFSPTVSGSLDYSRLDGADIARAAMAIRFKPTAPITALRWEQYHRFNRHHAHGFVVSADRPLTKWVRLNAGFATIDEFYGQTPSRIWNGDRYQRGRRVFANANITLVGPLSAAIFATYALDEDYTVSNRQRYDFVVTYDVLASLRKTGIF